MYDLKKYKVILIRTKDDRSETKEVEVEAVSKIDAVYKCIRFKKEGWQVFMIRGARDGEGTEK